MIPPVAAHSLALYPPIAFTAADLEQVRAHTVKFVQQDNCGAAIECVAVEGNVAPEIVRLARELPADLIVMGTHGRTGFDRLMLGSVTERILRKAPCPVLTVPRRAPDAVPVGPVLFKRILCAIDYSPSAMKALTYATSLAEQAGAHLTAVHVLEHLPVLEPVVVGVPGEREDP